MQDDRRSEVAAQASAGEADDSKDSLLIMTTQTVTVPRSWRAALVLHSNKIIRFAGLAFVAACGFAGAFTHMHDWTAEALPRSADWLCWANAGISEVLPTISFLSWRDRVEQKRKTTMPLWVFLGSSVISLFANVSATGMRLPGDKYLLSALPMLAVLVLFKMVLGDLEYARKDREREAADAEQRAELDRRRTEQAAELAAELARNKAREDAELAAELDRRAREHEAELARQAAERETAERLKLAQIEQAAITERERLAALERAETRRDEQERERRRADAEAAAFAEAERIKAQAEAERIAAEVRLLEAEAAAKEQAAVLLATREMVPAGRHRETAGGNVQTLRQRRPRAETEAIAAAAMATLPAGTSRDDAVKVVARAIGNTERYAREFVPADWSAGSSAGGEAVAA